MTESLLAASPCGKPKRRNAITLTLLQSGASARSTLGQLTPVDFEKRWASQAKYPRKRGEPRVPCKDRL